MEIRAHRARSWCEEEHKVFPLSGGACVKLIIKWWIVKNFDN